MDVYGSRVARTAIVDKADEALVGGAQGHAGIVGSVTPQGVAVGKRGGACRPSQACETGRRYGVDKRDGRAIPYMIGDTEVDPVVLADNVNLT